MRAITPPEFLGVRPKGVTKTQKPKTSVTPYSQPTIQYSIQDKEHFTKAQIRIESPTPCSVKVTVSAWGDDKRVYQCDKESNRKLNTNLALKNAELFAVQLGASKMGFVQALRKAGWLVVRDF